MRISFSPLRTDEVLSVSKSGDALTINGEEFDFTSLDEGAILPREAISGTELISGPVTRVDGDVHIQLRLPYRIGNRHVETPEPITVTADGPVRLPNLDGDL